MNNAYQIITKIKYIHIQYLHVKYFYDYGLLGSMYQIIDICITSAEPTEDLDALTIGMICVKNLQVTKNKFNSFSIYSI